MQMLQSSKYFFQLDKNRATRKTKRRGLLEQETKHLLLMWNRFFFFSCSRVMPFQLVVVVVVLVVWKHVCVYSAIFNSRALKCCPLDESALLLAPRRRSYTSQCTYRLGRVSVYLHLHLWRQRNNNGNIVDYNVRCVCRVIG